MPCTNDLDISQFLNGTWNFSYTQLMDYFDQYSKFSCFQKKLVDARRMGFVVNGLLGVFSYLIMIVVLRFISISKCTKIYYNSMALMEIPHMVIMAVSGIT